MQTTCGETMVATRTRIYRSRHAFDIRCALIASGRYVGTIVKCWSKGIVKITYDDPDEWEGEAIYVHPLPDRHPGHTGQVMVGANSPMGPGGGQQAMAMPMTQPGMMAMGQPMMGQPMMGQPMMGGVAPAVVGQAVMAQPVMGQPVMGQPMMGQPMMAQPAQPQMQVMSVVATVPGGQAMQLQGPNGVMTVMVPPGVMPGQQFQFQVPA